MKKWQSNMQVTSEPLTAEMFKRQLKAYEQKIAEQANKPNVPLIYVSNESYKAVAKLFKQAQAGSPNLHKYFGDKEDE